MGNDSGVTTGAAGAISGDAADCIAGTDGFGIGASGVAAYESGGGHAPWVRINSTSSTYVVWFKTSTTPVNESFLVSTGSDDAYGQYGISLVINHLGELEAMGGGATSTTSYAVTDGGWHQAVATYADGVGIQVSVDGFPAVAGSDPGGHLDWTPAVGQTLRFGQDASVNYGIYGVVREGSYTGCLDEVAIYPYAMSLEQIRKDYTTSGRIALPGWTSPVPTPTPTPPGPGGNGGDGLNDPALRNGSLTRGCACDPVDTGSGEFSESLPGIAVASRSPGMSMAINYRSDPSGTLTDVGEGYGWSSPLNMQIERFALGGPMVVEEEQGSSVAFVPQGDGTWIGPGKDVASLVHNGDGTWTFTRNGTDQYTFYNPPDPNASSPIAPMTTGKLKSMSDLLGDTTTVHYPSSGSTRADYLIDDGGQKLDIAWWSSGRLKSVSDELPSGDGGPRSIQLAYYSNGDLEYYTDTSGGVSVFTYDSNHRLTTWQKPRGATTHQVVTNDYDTSGRVDWQTDELNRKTTFTYGYSGHSGWTLVTNPQTSSKRLDEYDTTGVKTDTIEGYGSSSPVDTAMAFDANTHALTSSTDNAGDVTHWGFDPTTGDQTSEQDPTGRITRWTYDAFHQVVDTQVGETTTDTSHIVTNENVYDPTKGYLKSTTLAKGTGVAATTTYTRDPAHLADVLTVNDANNNNWTYTYDPTTGEQLTAKTPKGEETDTTYDSIGRVKTVTSPKGAATTGTPHDYETDYSYDIPGRSTTVTNPTGTSTKTVLDADGNTSSVATRITSSDPVGKVTSYSYDDADELTRVTNPLVTGESSASHRDTTYFDDGQIHTTTDENGNTTTYGYDDAGRLTSSQAPTAQDGPSGTTSYSYDTAGRLQFVTQPGSGNTCTGTKVGCITYGYDTAGRPQWVDYSDASTPDITNIIYDTLGRRTAATRCTTGTPPSCTTGTTELWSWNALSQLTSHTDASGQVTGYGWDGNGNNTSITYPGTATPVVRDYNSDNELDQVTDFDGRTAEFDDDSDGNLQTSTFGPKTSPTNTDVYGYDTSDAMNSVNWHQGASNGTSLGAETYSRPASNAGDVTSIAPSGSAGSSTKTASLDDRDRLTALTGSGGTMTYDPAGDLTKTSDGHLQVFDPAQRLCWASTTTSGSCLSPSSDATTYSYDARGNRTGQAPAHSAPSTYGYDQANRLASATVPSNLGGDGQLTTFTATRMLDTSAGTGTCTPSPCTTLAASTPIAVSLAGVSPLPSTGVESVWATVTVSGSSSAGYLKVNPNTVGTAAAATVNFTSGATVNETAIVPVVSGQITLNASVPVNVIIDVTGYFKAAGSTADAYHSFAPTRLVDTRSGTGTCNGSPCTTPAANSTTLVATAGPSGFPTSGVDAAVISLTIVGPPTTAGTLKVSGSSGTGGAATIAYPSGHDVNETVIAPVDSSGRMTIWVDHAVDYVIDVSGYFTDPAPGNLGLAYHPLPPTNLVTSSSGTGPCVGAACGTLVASTRQTVQVTGGTYGVPASASAVVGSLTLVTPSGSDGFARLNPTFTTGMGLAGDETINFLSGVTRNTTVLIPLKSDGTIQIVSNQAGNWILDISGYLTQPLGTWTYTYDVDGTRATKTAPDATTTTFTYSDQATLPLLLEQTTGANTTAIIYGPDDRPIEQVAITTSGDTAEWLHEDQLGSVRLATAANTAAGTLGTKVASQSFDPFGRQSASPPPTGAQTLLGYQGQYLDPETGIIYLRARYYDPATAQFMTVDPIVGVTGNPYAYTAGDPLDHSDPLGLCWSPSCVAHSVGHFVAQHRGAIATAISIGVCVSGIGTPACLAATGGALLVRAQQEASDHGGWRKTAHHNIVDATITGTSTVLIGTPSDLAIDGSEELGITALKDTAPSWVPVVRGITAVPDVLGLLGDLITQHQDGATCQKEPS